MSEKDSILDINKQVKRYASFKTADGQTIDNNKLAETLGKFLLNQSISKESNDVKFTVYPIIASIIYKSFKSIFGSETSNLFLNTETSKNIIINCMAFGFILHQYMQTNNLKVEINEEEISEEEIEKYERFTKLTSLIQQGMFAGIYPDEIIKELYLKGELTEDDLISLDKKDIGKEVDDLTKDQKN